VSNHLEKQTVSNPIFKIGDSMNPPWASFWQLVHDTVRELPDYLEGDLCLIDAMTEPPNLFDLVKHKLDRTKFIEAVIQLRNKYRGK
jgi:hypothetical protein